MSDVKTFLDGRVQLFHGNCIEIMAGLEEKSVDMVMTDPPYGHNNNNGDLIHRIEAALGNPTKDSSARPILNDGEEADPLFRAMLTAANRVLKSPGCCCCCCCGGGPDPSFARWSLWMDEIFKFKQAVVWDKGPMGLGWHYRRSYEFVLVAEKRGAGASKWYDTTKKVENIIRGCKCRSDRVPKIIPRKNQHPTEKPVALGDRFIRWHTAEDDLVLDPFMGGGAFAESAVRAGRRFIGIELDPAFFSLACQRMRGIVDSLGADYPKNNG